MIGTDCIGSFKSTYDIIEILLKVALNTINLNLLYCVTGSRYTVVRPAVCLEPGREYKIRIHFNHYKTNVATPDATTLIDSVSLFYKMARN